MIPQELGKVSFRRITYHKIPILSNSESLQCNNLSRILVSLLVRDMLIFTILKKILATIRNRFQ